MRRFLLLALLVAESSLASGPTASLFGTVAQDIRPFNASAAAFGGEARVGWAFIDELSLELSGGFTRSTPQSWLLHLGLGPKLALFTDAPVSPYVRANAGVGGRTPSEVVCAAGPSFDCSNRWADWAPVAAAALGADFQVVRNWRLGAELGWRRFFLDDARFARDVRGLWMGISFR